MCLPVAEITFNLLHIHVWMLLEACEIIDENAFLLHVSQIPIASLNQSTKIQIKVYIFNRERCTTADWYFRFGMPTNRPVL